MRTRPGQTLQSQWCITLLHYYKGRTVPSPYGAFSLKLVNIPASWVIVGEYKITVSYNGRHSVSKKSTTWFDLVVKPEQLDNVKCKFLGILVLPWGLGTAAAPRRDGPRCVNSSVSSRRSGGAVDVGRCTSTAGILATATALRRQTTTPGQPENNHNATIPKHQHNQITTKNTLQPVKHNNTAEVKFWDTVSTWRYNYSFNILHQSIDNKHYTI